MKAGNFNIHDYLKKLNEESEGNTEKGFVESDPKDGILIPGDTKRNFDWLKKEYQKGKVEVKVEIKGEGSSFSPGYDLQTDLKSVKDFKPGMYGEIKTGDTGKSQPNPHKTEEPSSPKNKKEDVAAEEKDPKGGKEQEANTKETSDKSPKAQQMKVDVSSKKKKDDK